MGEAGTGKTTLIYSLLGLLERRRFVTALCTNPTLSREEFYDILMIKFGVDCGSSLKSRQLTALEETLRRHRSEGKPSILIVDEAQRLSPELLEEIRLLLNMETATEKLLQIIVSGQPELGNVLAQPDLRQLKQRVSCVSKLKPLDMEELKEYLRHRLNRAGLAQQTLFPAETVELIYVYTKGIPRLINSLCAGALQIGLALQSSVISTNILEEAAKDLDLVRSPEIEELAAVTQMSRVAASTVSKAANPSVSVNGSGHNGYTGTNGTKPAQMPMESYAARQKSLGFFGSLIGRRR
jgi:general secretion pathway protein A